MSRVIAGMSSWNVGKRRRSVVRSARTEHTASSISSYMCSNCTVNKETSSLILFRTVRDHYCSAEGMLQTMIHSELEERRQFSCEKCGKGYLHFRNLHRHRRHECGKLPSFGCTVCSYRAFQKVHVQKHMRRKHMKELLTNPDLPPDLTVPGLPFVPAYL
ncbi:hypothetical protein J6590_002315 [Homalodisca vitripennis]|nr:hypothetical protein J6590_002315 [Homalodisca vitripennis]